MHGKYARPVSLVLFWAMGNHGQNLFLVLATEQSVSSDHRALFPPVNND